MANASQPGVTASTEEDRLIAREREIYHRIQNDLQGIVALMHGSLLQHPEYAKQLQGPINHLMNVAQIYRLRSFNHNIRINIMELVQAITERLIPAVSVQGLTGASTGPPLIAENKEVVLALILDQLICNALQHSWLQSPPASQAEDLRARIRMQIELRPELARFVIRNRSASLPPGFDFNADQGLQEGLALIHSILPRQGAALDIYQTGDDVVAELKLTPPVIEAN